RWRGRRSEERRMHRADPRDRGEAALPLALRDRAGELLQDRHDDLRERFVLDGEIAHHLDRVPLGLACRQVAPRACVVAALHRTSGWKPVEDATQEIAKRVLILERPG